MNQMRCLKLSNINKLIKKLEKIKIIIKDCNTDRYKNIENIFSKELASSLNESDKKKYTASLDKKLTLYKKKYYLLHNKLYNVVDTVINCKCCVIPDHHCNRDSYCLNKNDNEKVWELVDEIHNDLHNFYNDLELDLVLEKEICFHRLNKIKKIPFI